jgi:hypothetical protein
LFQSLQEKVGMARVILLRANFIYGNENIQILGERLEELIEASETF